MNQAPTQPPPPIPGTQVPFGSFEPPDVPPAPPAPIWDRSPATFGAVAVVLATAMAANLAVQSSVASAIAVVAVLGCIGLVSVSAKNPTRNLYLALGLTALLATNLVLRTSPWVIAPTVLAIATFLLLASAHHVTRSQPLLTVMVGVRWVENLFASIPWIAGPAIEASKRDDVQVQSVVRGVITAGAIGTLLILLLAAADSVFASMFGSLASSSIWLHGLLVGLFAVGVGALGASTSSEKPLAQLEFGGGRFGIEGFMGLMAITGVLALWCATQLFVALGHADQILSTEGLTRAEYARRGFFELVVVAVVVVSLLNILDRVTERTSRRANQLFTGLGVLAALETIVLVAITYGRLDFYMDEFGLTMLRLSVACFLAWLAIVLVMVAARLAGLGGEQGWTAVGSLVLAGLFTVGFGWANPEARVASYNLSTQSSAELDGRYLTTLSADAQPTLIAELANLSSSRAEQISDDLCRSELRVQKYSILDWNLSHSNAQDARQLLNC